MLERLLYADAWDTDDASQAQDAINSVLDVIDRIGQFEECCDMIDPIENYCCCPQPSMTQIINNYSSYQYQNESFQETIINSFDMSIAAELNMTSGDVASELSSKIITDNQICVASHLFLYALHDMGTLAAEGLIEYDPTFQKFRQIGDAVRYISGAAPLLGGIFPASIPFFVGVALAGQYLAAMDDVIVLETAAFYSEIEQAVLEDYACSLYNAMIAPDAGYVEFASASFNDVLMDGWWADFASPQMYSAWLALLDNTAEDLDFSCCSNCTVYYPTHEQIIHGRPNTADPNVLQTVETGSGSSLTKQATVQIDLGGNRQVKKVSVWCIGKRYHPLGLNYHIRSKRDSEAYVEMVRADGSAFANADMAEANVYFAPQSQVSALTPQASTWEINIVYASCQACSSSELEKYAGAYGLMFAITICWE